jgi:hypothetical protein
MVLIFFLFFNLIAWPLGLLVGRRFRGSSEPRG